MENIQVPVSPGEVLDKITILEIKSERMTDPEKVAKYHRLYLEKGDEIEFFDSRRPDWIPHVPLW